MSARKSSYFLILSHDFMLAHSLPAELRTGVMHKLYCKQGEMKCSAEHQVDRGMGQDLNGTAGAGAGPRWRVRHSCQGNNERHMCSGLVHDVRHRVDQWP